MKILDNAEKVKVLLESNPKYRDDYKGLIARVWFEEIERSKDLKAIELLNKLAKGELSHPESIMRARRKIQENNPNLRGETYKKRQTEVKAVQTELGYCIAN
jgi:hypothetical protein